MKPVDRCGYIAIIGRPNVGKSTLLNRLIGKKISITSPKPQTTRNQILGIKTCDHAQAIYIDTPGLHATEKYHKGRAMNRYLNRLANSVIIDADAVVFIIEASRYTADDEAIFEKLTATKAPVILVINKVDLVKDKSHLLPLIEKLESKHAFAHVVPLSAKNNDNVDTLEKIIMELLPEGPHFFPDEQVTDKSDSFQAAEIIREKLIQHTGEELPYATTVIIESFKDKGEIIHINAIIWVEKEGQKPIVIGKNGERLKKIGTLARQDIEARLGKKVFLRLWVKVKSNWTSNERLLHNLGYE